MIATPVAAPCGYQEPGTYQLGQPLTDNLLHDGPECRLWIAAWAEFVPFLQFDQEIRTIICTTNAIVIRGGFEGVLDVLDERLRSGDSVGGRGYLRLSSRRIPGRFGACSAGGDARLAA